MNAIKKTYGPYVCPSDGRKRVTLVYEDKSKRTLLLSKHLMEQHLGRRLDPILETVDHINEDPTDDRLENLQLLTLSENAKKSARLPELQTYNCVLCGIECTKLASVIRSNRAKGKAGPFCGKSCAGTYSKAFHKKRGSKQATPE